jgi:hypothetical protein
MSLIGINKKDYKPNNDYYTPKWIFDALGVEFDVDVAAPKGGLDWIPAKRFIDIEQDGLNTEWIGKAWMNPPYSQCVPWVRRFREHNNGIALLPTSKAAWFKHLFDDEKVSVLHPSQNVRFTTPNNEVKGIFMPTLLFGMGEECIQALHNSKLGRVR